jgi:hypothetical protein
MEFIFARGSYVSNDNQIHFYTRINPLQTEERERERRERGW